MPHLVIVFRAPNAYNEARPRERNDRGLFLRLGQKASSYRGAYRVCHDLVGLSVCVCVTFVVFIDRESCTRTISTSPGSMEAGEYGLTRGTRFVASCLEVVAVAGLMWVSWCVSGGAGFFRVFFLVFFSSNAHGLLQVRGRFVPFTSLLVVRQMGGIQAIEADFCL